MANHAAQQRDSGPKPRSFVGFVCRIILRTFLVAVALVALYLCILLVGLLPANAGFEPTPDGVSIYVISSSVHADIVLPISNSTIDWRGEFPPTTFQGDTRRATHAAFGWGDRGFYVGTPTWDDLKLSTAANALLMPSECCMHVKFMRNVESINGARRVRLSDEQYQKLVQVIQRSFKTDGEKKIQIPDAAYSYDDAFFTATGNYHALNTCNSWVGHALRSAGVKAPMLTPMPGSPTLYLPQVDAASVP